MLINLYSKVTSKPQMFTLDTGRLPIETYQVWKEIERRYSIQLEVYFPDCQKVESRVHKKLINLFYNN